MASLPDPHGASAARVLAEIDSALATADSALALLAFEVRRQRDVAAQRVAQREREAADKRKRALELHAAKLLKAHSRKQAQDALAAEADRLINQIESTP